MRGRIIIACPGVGHIRRGFETFSEELAVELRNRTADDVMLVGSGEVSRLFKWFTRHGDVARCLARMTRRDGYYIEQVAYAAALVPLLRGREPTTVISGDGTVLNVLWRLRSALRRMRWPDYRLVLSNSAPFSPPYCWCDYIQHTCRTTFDHAILRGGKEARHGYLPLGVATPSRVTTEQEYWSSRTALGFKEGDTVVLSVGAIGGTHKRHVYLVNEIAALRSVGVILIIAGQAEAGFDDFKTMAYGVLGDRLRIVSGLPRAALNTYYAGADILVHCSLDEGFGRVVVEAIGSGLPVLVHDSPALTSSFDGLVDSVNMTHSGSLRLYLERSLRPRPFDAEYARRAREAAERFGWPHLAPRYIEMLALVRSVPAISDSQSFRESLCPG